MIATANEQQRFVSLFRRICLNQTGSSRRRIKKDIEPRSGARTERRIKILIRMCDDSDKSVQLTLRGKMSCVDYASFRYFDRIAVANVNCSETKANVIKAIQL
jgi:hypothetical protein